MVELTEVTYQLRKWHQIRAWHVTKTIGELDFLVHIDDLQFCRVLRRALGPDSHPPLERCVSGSRPGIGTAEVRVAAQPWIETVIFNCNGDRDAAIIMRRIQ